MKSTGFFTFFPAPSNPRFSIFSSDRVAVFFIRRSPESAEQDQPVFERTSLCLIRQRRHKVSEPDLNATVFFKKITLYP